MVTLTSSASAELESTLDPTEAPPPERWSFSVAAEVAGYGFGARGKVSSTDITGPRVGNPRVGAGDDGVAVVMPRASGAQVSSALLGGSVEVMSPIVSPYFGDVRIFADLNFSVVLTNDVGLARDGDPGEMDLPRVFIAQQLVGELTIRGRGTKITAQPQGPQIYAGIGPAFTVRIEGEQFRIKPSVVYSRTTVDLFGVGHRAVRLNNDNGPRLDFDDDFRLIQLSDSAREIYHGLGPALEIEYLTSENVGPFGMTVFLKGHATHIFGNLTTRLEQSNSDPAALGETIRWVYSQDRWAFRVSTGVRLRWAPR
ncbi:MAG: hypothetical protein VCB25_01795 [Myxococcota bacterium]